MRWTVTLVAEIEPGQRIEHEIVAVDRDDRITPASLGLSIAEGKAMLAAIQARVVVDQVKRHGMVARHCRWCGSSQSSKGHYRSTFRSVFGNVPMQGAAVSGVPMPPRRASDRARAVQAPSGHCAGTAVPHGEARRAAAVWQGGRVPR